MPAVGHSRRSKLIPIDDKISRPIAQWVARSRTPSRRVRPDAQGVCDQAEGHPRSGPRRRRAGRGVRIADIPSGATSSDRLPDLEATAEFGTPQAVKRYS